MSNEGECYRGGCGPVVLGVRLMWVSACLGVWKDMGGCLRVLVLVRCRRVVAVDSMVCLLCGLSLAQTGSDATPLGCRFRQGRSCENA